MGGYLKVCIAASNEPDIHKSQMLCAEAAVRRVGTVAVELLKWYRLMGFNASQCTWLQMG